ncbi:MAG: hypothetical protein Q4B34_00060 [Candidatus Saccharibacteria bacterium]|nr:hypothetical protein [Candidatus Saccharibacteria bacterium]
MNTQVAFYEDAEAGASGKLAIIGLTFPYAEKLDPLGKIWASLRKCITKELGVDSAAIFSYKTKDKKILVSFYVNVGILDSQQNADVKEYIKKYKDSFKKQSEMFEDVIQKFIAAEEGGYTDYLKLLSDYSGRDEIREKSDEFINAFLVKIGIRRSRNKALKVAPQ